MNIEKYKQLHPEEYKVAEAQIIQSAIAKATSDSEAEKTKWEAEKVTLQAAIDEAKKKAPPDGLTPSFKDSPEFKAIVLQNETLVEQNSLLIKKNSAMDLAICGTKADEIVTIALQKSIIPEALWGRVRNSSAIDHKKFLLDDPKALTITLDQEKFAQALQAEVTAWEASIPKEIFSVGGLPLKGEDGQIKTGQQAEAEEWLKKQRNPDNKTYGKKK